MFEKLCVSVSFIYSPDVVTGLELVIWTPGNASLASPTIWENRSDMPHPDASLNPCTYLNFQQTLDLKEIFAGPKKLQN